MGKTNTLINSISRDIVFGINVLPLVFLSTTETKRLKLLAYRGEENCTPYTRLFVHYIESTSGNKKMVKCLGKGCCVCKYNRAQQKILFYCDDGSETLKCFIAPSQILEAIFGKKGQPSHIFNMIVNGDNIFSPKNGSLLEINRSHVGSGDDFHVRVVAKQQTSKKVYGALLAARPLELIPVELTEAGYMKLEECLKYKLPFNFERLQNNNVNNGGIIYDKS